MALRKEVEQAITQARIYDLSVEFYVGVPRRMTVPPFSFSLIRAHRDAPDPRRHSSAACLFSMGGHTGTHIDAFNHIAEGGRVYGHPEAIFEHESYGSGVLIGAIDETPPILRRGILLDIPRVRGVDFLGPKDVATPDDFRAAEQVENVQVSEGDVVLVRTGWMHWWAEDPQRYNAPVDVIPGVGLSAAEWLAERKIAFTGADTTSYEKVDQTKHAVHTLFLNKVGIQIMENMYLEEVARDRVYEFVFVALPLRIKGGTASPIRPVAVLC